MTVPSQSDIKKREEKLKQFLKNLDETGKGREAKVLGIVRSAIRSAWLKSDTKLAYLYMNTIPDMDDSTRTKWLWKCEICGNLFKLNEINVDHKHGNHQFTKVENFPEYFEKILMVGFDDLQILCIEDHKQKSLSESLGVSFEEAGYHKTAIELQKTKKDKEWLQERKVVPSKNKDKRREQIVEFLKEEKENES